jgi:NADH:ubiquinone oxidoreductase subunit 6 (subunit J)
LQRIFDKLSVKDSWLAWVPIANAVKIFQVGDKNPWLLLLIFIPFVGAIAVLVLSIMAMMNIAKKLGKESWLAIAIIVPILGLWAMYSLAFP